MQSEQVDLEELGLAGESMESVLMTIEKIFMIED
jgi:hypothetical protein